ncbi:hypothetical protein SAMN04488498_1588 [Mesorhizobium albiziae]|uniref:Uncharacterized protein n=1 Tax=Neomesorhizobium albiziae TaxID=335020 RepID=A0A1I4FSX4_9HYPH|nr:hypothetical protein [Mesorhizobium albiziae]GLS34355.1 hypothetical protein GCM10007937_60700 [Mesorhizobium albiziae]SFL20958.1 hypothetical protein SAMN04488498_1588 [Mesorhizobium albiziae]
MKTASTLLQILALAACFTIYLSGNGGAQLTGVRRAMQTMAVSVNQPATPAPSDAVAADAC